MKHQDPIPLYNGAPIPFTLAPLDITKKAYSFIETSLTEVLKQVENFTSLALKDVALLKQLDVTPGIDAAPTPLGLHIPFARFDFTFDMDRKLQILELNTDGTSGWNMMEWLGDRSGMADSSNPNKGLSEKLLKGILAHKPDASRLHLLDFPDVMTGWEQDDLIRRWIPHFPCVKSSPSVRDWDEKSLIYRRAVSWQLDDQKEEAEPFLSDWKNGLLTVVGGRSSDVGMSKAWPAILKHPLFPETVLVSSENRVRIEKEKDQWILKRKFSHSGRGTMRGVDVSRSQWTDKLNAEPGLVAQKLIELPQIDGDRVELGMFFINGVASGCMVRSGHKGSITDVSEDVMRPIRLID